MITTGYFRFSPAHSILPGKGSAYLLSAKGCCLQDLVPESLPSFPDKTLSCKVLPLKCWRTCGAKSVQWPLWRGKEWLSSFLVIWTVWESPTAAACHWASSSLILQFQVPTLDGSKPRPVSWEEGGKPQAQEIWKRLTIPPSPPWTSSLKQDQTGQKKKLYVFVNISVLKIRLYDLNCQRIILTFLEWPEKAWDLH